MSMSVPTGTEIKFSKKEKSGVFQNYYLYANSENNVENFSFVCPITITICYFSCQTCVSNKTPSFEQHFCTSCIKYYSPKNNEENNIGGYNCYLNNCDTSCKYCTSENFCESCKEGYYFKSDINNLISKDICYKDLENYFLDNNVNIIYNGENITAVYKPCYETCSSCSNTGTIDNNNCILCKEGIKYPFNNFQCTLDKQTCLNNQSYWRFNNNNIECISDCDKNIIFYGENKGQCVEDCQNYNNPYLITNEFLSLSNCDGNNYCISSNNCTNGNFEIDTQNRVC